MKFTFPFFLLLFILTSKAQSTKFITSGSIEFEQKINLYRLYRSDISMLDILKKANLQFRKSLITLNFDSSQTLYEPSKANSENITFQSLVPIGENGVYINFDTKIRLRRKQIRENTVFVSDSINKIRWKITDERRQIAGFNCKRANAIILDSIYVVAYFTEEILVQGGPESFCGLPGMILGVALPQEHITWFATKVSVLRNTSPIQPFAKQKTISSYEFKQIINQNFNTNDEIDKWYYKFSLL